MGICEMLFIKDFSEIRKMSEGRFWNIIVTYQDRRDAWVAVAQQFSEAMAIEFTPKQCKDLWFRIKVSKQFS